MTYMGETIVLADLAERVGVSGDLIVRRLNKGMSPEEAVADALGQPYTIQYQPVAEVRP